MAKTTSKTSADRKKRTRPKSEEKLTTLSIRLTEQEKELLSRAAGAHRLSSTQFIKRAALTRAAQTHNIETHHSFDFNAIADRIVELLFADFPKEVLARLTPKAMKQLTVPKNDQPKLPPDGEGNYEAVPLCQVMMRELQWDVAQWDVAPRDEPLEVWLRMDKIPPERRSDDWKPEDVPEAAPVIRDARKKFTVDELRSFMRAFHLGGDGFVDIILSCCSEYWDDDFDPHDRGQSPVEPIDPKTFGELNY